MSSWAEEGVVSEKTRSSEEVGLDRCLTVHVCKREDLSLIPRTRVRMPGMVMCACIPSIRNVETG